MITVRLDYKGAYQVKWPTRSSAILALGQAYTNYESSLPAGSQLGAPDLATIQAAYDAAQTAQTAAGSGEAARAIAAETYRQTIATAKQRLEVAIVRLKSNYLSNLAQLEQWGLDTVVGSKGISVRKPRSDKEWAAFLAAYVAKETSLDPGDQMIDPPLAEMTSLNSVLQTANAARTAGRNQREENVQTRSVEVQRLLDLLQGAAVVLVLTRYNGMVTNGLQNWGFEVTAVVPTPPKEEEEEETAEQPV